MSVGSAHTVALLGLDAVDVVVEAHVATGLPGFSVIGSSGSAAREAAERVRTALMTVDAQLARSKILVSLAPADLPKAGARYDLAMAMAVLSQRGVVPKDALHRTALLGELALDGAVRPVPGVLPSAYHLQRGQVDRLFVAEPNGAEALTASRLDVVGIKTLGQAVRILRGDERAPEPIPHRGTGAADPAPVASSGDLADVRGQTMARRALEIAAAGGHHLVLLGPPGCGKSMLATRLPGLLPPLSEDQAFTLAAVRSVVGMLDEAQVLDRRPPFRAPHHTVSAAALLGGGSGVARPGQLSLASGGVLFLDELFEWSRTVLDALREPLEDGVVRVARSRATVTYPAQVQLVCAANPCPCGEHDCACAPEVVWRYRAKLSGPLADRLDLAPTMEPLRARDLQGPPGEHSVTVAGRVRAARMASLGRHGAPTSQVPPDVIRRGVSDSAARALARAVDHGELTGRGHDRSLRVARTIADLAGSQTVHDEHIDEAMLHRLSLARARGASQVLVGTSSAHGSR